MAEEEEEEEAILGFGQELHQDTKATPDTDKDDEAVTTRDWRTENYELENPKVKRNVGFWKGLGNPRFITAPMVDLSELPFRLLTRKYGADLTYTPMLHSRLFCQASYRYIHLDVSSEDRPVFAQFCGNNAATLLEAASYVEGLVDAIDLNLGCPQGIARRGHYGAYLLNQPALVTSLVSALCNGLPGRTPITCKVRKVSQDVQQTVNLCADLEARGCAAICVHGRTKEEKCQFTGVTDWEVMRIVKQRLRIPVIANGGIESYQDALDCLAYTGADAVMSAEAILEHPALFSGNRISQEALARDYLDFVQRYPPKMLKCLRTHLFRILHSKLQVHCDLRDKLAQAQSMTEFTNVTEELTSRAEESYLLMGHSSPLAHLPSTESASKDSEPSAHPITSSHAGDDECCRSWYRRHRTHRTTTTTTNDRL